MFHNGLMCVVYLMYVYYVHDKQLQLWYEKRIRKMYKTRIMNNLCFLFNYVDLTPTTSLT